MAEPRASTGAYPAGRDFKQTVLRHPYAFNLFTQHLAVCIVKVLSGGPARAMTERERTNVRFQGRSV
jgi:hypothetical protein